MLVITRKSGEHIVVNTGTETITIIVREIVGQRVKLVMDAPPSVRIETKTPAVQSGRLPPPQFRQH